MRDRGLVDDGRRTGRLGSPFPLGRQTCNPSLWSATASADAPRPARRGRESIPSLSREAVGVQPPTPSRTPLLDLIPVLLFSLCCFFCLRCLLLQNLLSTRAATPPLNVSPERRCLRCIADT